MGSFTRTQTLTRKTKPRMLTLRQDTRSHQTLKTLNTTNQTPLQIGPRSLGVQITRSLGHTTLFVIQNMWH